VKTYGTEFGDWGNDVIQTDDGGYLITGHTGPYPNYDVWLIKTNSDGDEEWNETYGGTEGDVGISLLQTDDFNYLVVGWTASFGSSGADTDIWLLKLNQVGEKIWEKRYGEIDTQQRPTDISKTTDNGYIIVGCDDCYDSSDYWLIKVNSTGGLI